MSDQSQNPTPADGTSPTPGSPVPPAGAPAGGYQQPAPGYQQPYGQPAPTAPGYYGQPPMSDADQRLWATLGHVAGIVFGWLGALVVYLIFKDRGEYVKYQNKESLNFQLTLLIAEIVGWITALFVVGFFILAAVYILRIVFGIMAAVAANRGEPYRYPFCLRMVS